MPLTPSITLSAWTIALTLPLLSPLAVSTHSTRVSRGGAQKPAELSLGTKGNELAFDQAGLRARAGQPIQLTFTNRADQGSGLQHNWVLVKHGAKDEVVTLAIQAGAGKGYVPESPLVLAATRLLGPGESQTLRFQAPDQPGDYPYFCSVPGHAKLLQGTLTVEK